MGEVFLFLAVFVVFDLGFILGKKRQQQLHPQLLEAVKEADWFCNQYEQYREGARLHGVWAEADEVIFNATSDLRKMLRD